MTDLNHLLDRAIAPFADVAVLEQNLFSLNLLHPSTTPAAASPISSTSSVSSWRDWLLL